MYPSLYDQISAYNFAKTTGYPYNIPVFGNTPYSNFAMPSSTTSNPNDWSNLSFGRKFDMINAGLQTGLGIANLGLGIDSHITNKKLAKKELENMTLKNQQLRADMDFLASERARFKNTVANTNKMISGSNNHLKPII